MGFSSQGYPSQAGLYFWGAFLNQANFIKIRLTFYGEYNFGQNSKATSKHFIQIPVTFFDDDRLNRVPNYLRFSLFRLLKKAVSLGKDTLIVSRNDFDVTAKVSLSTLVQTLIDAELAEIVDAAVLVNKRKEKKIREKNIIEKRPLEGEILVEGGFDFELIYSNYPKRSGDSKKKTGFDYLTRKITSQDLFESALKAVQNYRTHCDAEGKTGTSYVKQFSTFFGADETWREYINYTAPLVKHVNKNQKSTSAPPAHERNENLDERFGGLS